MSKNKSAASGSERERAAARKEQPPATAPAAKKKSGLLIKIVLLLVAAAVVLVVVVMFQPADFHVERSATISAPPAAAFAQVNDFHNWDAWSPWAKLDPQMKQNYEGPPAGIGAVYTWSGNTEVGEGRMTIVDSRPSELIRIKLEFLRPFAATNVLQFTFNPEGKQTSVTWSMDGKNSFLAKAFHLVMNMDTLVGKDFEKGLASMKAVVEAPPTQ